MLKALRRCGLDWGEVDARESVCKSVSYAWIRYSQEKELPGLAQALLEKAPDFWWSERCPKFEVYQGRHENLMDEVLESFPAGDRRRAMAAKLTARRLGNSLSVRRGESTSRPRF